MIDFKLIYKGKPSKLVNMNHYQTKFKKKLEYSTKVNQVNQ